MSQECSCGKWYATAEGVAMCQANYHGNVKRPYEAKSKATHTIERTITVICQECEETLSFRVAYDRDGDIEIKILPHLCQVDAPEIAELDMAA